ncbi:pentatricopeptide repeat-containing protein At1g02370, mitochondrial [Nymphaea colorata]|nr:pentatricopeptide repeat-containing protein At1g02370, mitochondrial [Nymphaea colorata]
MGSLGRALSKGSIRCLTTAAAARESAEGSLFQRLTALAGTDGSAGVELNKWLEEGKSVKKWEIERFIKRLRGYKRFKHALQLSEWMDTKDMKLSRGDYAVRIDLLAKTQGVDSAEKYFHSLPKAKRNWATYGALLNCYCVNKMTEKAESLFGKMKEEKFACTSLVYNNIMTLYLKIDQPQRVPPLVQEMKGKGLKLDIVSYNLLMNSYAAMNDVEGAEKVVEEMKGEGKAGGWSTYSNLAAIYVKAGLFEKAESTLKEVEKTEGTKSREVFQFLMSLYAGTGNAAEVYRIWDALKSAFPKSTNLSHLVMLQSLVRLGDISGARVFFDEWESKCLHYDFRLTNVMISVYLNRNMINEAESIFEGAKKKGGIPTVRTMEIFMDYHMKNAQFDFVLKFLDEAITKSYSNNWKMSVEKFQPLKKYFEENGNVDGAEELYEKFKKTNSLEAAVYDSLLRTYIAAGRTEPTMRQRIEADKVEVNPEMEKLLEKVCPL